VSLYWRHALSTRPCYGCTRDDPHTAHLTTLALVLLWLSAKGRALLRLAEREK